MIVTINTDAAYHSGLKIGGYAFWIVCNDGRFNHTGVLKSKISRPEEAEFQCIINAVHVLFNLKFKNVTKIIVNTDCLNVVHLINKNKQAIKRYRLQFGQPYFSKFEKLLSVNNFDKKNVELRHVKAHTDIKDKRSWANNWCDKKSKESMWIKINNTNNVIR